MNNLMGAYEWRSDTHPVQQVEHWMGIARQYQEEIESLRQQLAECQRERDELSLFRTVQERRHVAELEAVKRERDSFLNALLSITTGKANIPLSHAQRADIYKQIAQDAIDKSGILEKEPTC